MDIEFFVEVDETPPPRVQLIGEFDQAGLDEFDGAIRRVLDLRPETVVIDLGRLQFIGSCGLGRLIRTSQVHPGVVIKNVLPPQRRLFELTALDQVLRIEGAELETQS